MISLPSDDQLVEAGITPGGEAYMAHWDMRCQESEKGHKDAWQSFEAAAVEGKPLAPQLDRFLTLLFCRLGVHFAGTVADNRRHRKKLTPHYLTREHVNVLRVQRH